jgi:hypothetical protein
LAFFYNIAGCLKEAFGEYINDLVPFTLRILEQNNEIQEQKKKKEFSLDSDSEDEDLGAHFQMNYVYEKIAAICAIGHFANAAPMTFGPFFEPALAMLEKLFESQHADIRSEVIICYKQIAEAMVKFQNQGTLPKVQYGLPVQ